MEKQSTFTCSQTSNHTDWTDYSEDDRHNNVEKKQKLEQITTTNSKKRAEKEKMDEQTSTDSSDTDKKHNEALSSSKWNWKQSPERTETVGRIKHYRSGDSFRHQKPHREQNEKQCYKPSRKQRSATQQYRWSQMKRRESESDSESRDRPRRRYLPPETYTRPVVKSMDSTQEAARTFYLSIDIETSGPSMVHHFMPCFGAAFIDVEQCKVLEQRLFWIAQPDGTKWDAETVRSFWNTLENRSWYHEVLDRQESLTLPSLGETMRDFVDWVQNHLYSKYAEPHRSHNNVVQLISDNPSYDLGWLSYYLTLGTDGRVPHVQYLLNNKFNGRPIDTRSFCDGVRHKLHGPSFTRSDRYRQPRTVTQALHVSQWKKHILSEMGVRYDHNPKHDAVVIGINAAVVACALADQLRTSPTCTPCLAKYDGRTVGGKTRDSSSSRSSASCSPSESLPSPLLANLQQSKTQKMKPLDPSSATYVQHYNRRTEAQQNLFSQAYAHEALLQHARLNQQFRTEENNNTRSWRSSSQASIPIGHIVSNSGVSTAVGPFPVKK